MRLIPFLLLLFISHLLNAQTVAEKPLKIRKPGWMFSMGYGANYTIPTIKNPFWYSTEGVGGPKLHLSSQTQFNVGRRVFKDYWLLLGFGRVNREYKLYDLDPYSTTNASINTTGVVRLVSGIEFNVGIMGRHHINGPFYVQWELARAREFLAGAKRIEFTPTQTVQSFEYNWWFYSQRTRGTVKAAFQWQPKRKFALGLEPSYSLYLRDLGKIQTPDKTNLHSLALSLKGYVFL